VGRLRLIEKHADGFDLIHVEELIAIAFSVTGNPFDSARFETLNEPADVERWAADVLGASRIQATASSVPAAKRLRAAIWNAAESVIDGRAVPAADCSTLNSFAAPPSLVPRLDPDGKQSWVPADKASALFSSIARDMIDVVSGPLASRIRRYEGVNCAIPFVDTSRPGTRRWCSMERCGNRAKVTGHRRRHRQEVST
jgi:predicted RNA-binding Zn ribbon-like protein